MSEEKDIEALQAQIELSNSVAYDIVSSWMKPTILTSKESISDIISRELEDYAKRPQRLGLGSTVSKSTATTAREAARLKGKLIGQKRRREEEAAVAQANAAADSDDNEESRSSVIGNKKSGSASALSAFNGKAGKGKGKSPAIASADDSTSAASKPSTAKPNPFKVPEMPPHPPATFIVQTDQATTEDIPASQLPSKKKRKKNKNKHKEGAEKSTEAEEEEEWTGFGDVFIPDDQSEDVSFSGSRQPSIGPPPSTVITESSPEPSVTQSVASADVATPKKSPVVPLPPSNPPRGTSLLNLGGPPPVAEPQSPSPKKRRRRKNKSKDHQVTEAG
ncbi:hypothetical protein M422DRAFT_23209 [Sphaerobolus stellatus SS14]|nr:hypothetical protein M422DRAFT_23209 [Sphaerobolus stellatus SS14]